VRTGAEAEALPEGPELVREAPELEPVAWEPEVETAVTKPDSVEVAVALPEVLVGFEELEISVERCEPNVQLQYQ